MRILLTGATGFLGSHLLHGLLKDNHNIIILKRSYSNTVRIAHLLNKVKAYDTDITTIDSIFENNKLDVVIHTATSYGKNNSSTEVIESNLIFPKKLLDCSIHSQVPYIINTDTFFNKHIQNYEYLQFYTSTKKRFLDLLKLSGTNKFIQTINIRLEHIYGTLDNEDKFTTYVISQLLKNVPYLELTPGEQRRDFIYVNDVVEAYRAIINNLNKLHYGHNEFEVGIGCSISIKSFIETIKQLTKSNTTLEFGALPYRESEIMDSFADSTNLKKLGWTPKVNLSTGLSYVIDDMKKSR